MAEASSLVCIDYDSVKTDYKTVAKRRLKGLSQLVNFRVFAVFEIFFNASSKTTSVTQLADFLQVLCFFFFFFEILKDRQVSQKTLWQ